MSTHIPTQLFSGLKSHMYTNTMILTIHDGIKAIVSDLCDRDSRFCFIKDALDTFYFGDYGMIHAYRKLVTLDTLYGQTEPDLSQEHDPETVYEVEIIHRNSLNIILEITSATLYEVLYLYDIDITMEQVPDKPLEELNLLESLCEQTKQLRLEPRESMAHRLQGEEEPYRYTFQYPSRLISRGNLLGANTIRVLHLLPGPRKSFIECQLEVRNLDDAEDDEVLSYVWGKEHAEDCIWVDGSPFRVTKNLYDILINLRHPCTPRTVWIDAICINQTDLDEKAYQVRLMSDIYSRIRKVTIWLAGPIPEEQADGTPPSTFTHDPTAVLTPLPPRLLGNLVNQYDLIGILEQLHASPEIVTFDHKRVALLLMLHHCVNAIMSQEWWERIWTIQEAVLPLEHPTILFRGYQYSFADLVSAIQLSERFWAAVKDIPNFVNSKKLNGEPPEVQFVYWALMYQQMYLQSKRSLLQLLRPGQSNSRLSNPIDRQLDFLLRETSTYRATNPRDKLFALESLLPSSLGRLICVDYNESVEATFRRTTARCYNLSYKLGNIMAFFKLASETELSAGQELPGPSWVLDFTYSDAEFHRGRPGESLPDYSTQGSTEATTLEGCLSNSEYWQPLFQNGESAEPILCFATPRSLFCSGLHMGTICKTIPIPDLSTTDWETGLGQLLLDVASQRGHLVVDIERQLHEIFDLFTLDSKRSCEKGFGRPKDIINRRLREMAGRQFFITDSRLLGIATTPIKPGDILAAIHVSPVYLILSEMGNRGTEGPGVQEHRIVARAIISEKKEKMATWVKGMWTRRFQIV